MHTTVIIGIGLVLGVVAYFVRVWLDAREEEAARKRYEAKMRARFNRIIEDGYKAEPPPPPPYEPSA